VALDSEAKSRLARLAEKFLREEPSLADTRPFGDLVTSGLRPVPSLVIEDHSSITLFETVGDISYSHRACVLAGTGDLVVLGIERCRAFEAYCRENLGLGCFNVVSHRRSSAKQPLSSSCALDDRFIKQVEVWARASRGINIIPYMGTGGAWLLAGRIAEATGQSVTVTAPPPKLTRRVNDKLWFASCVTAAIGKSAVPKSFAAYGFAALTRQVSILSRRFPTVAIKLPSSASSAGIVVLESEMVRDLSPLAQRRYLRRALRMTGWRNDFPLLVTQWESPVRASPSVQLWIPGRDQGDPVIEGIFEQQLIGKTAAFRGAIPTRLPESLQARLAHEAALLGYFFQCLGYFGRCSLDSILVGERKEEVKIHWVECNGRWGGTSIPMTLANRLLGDLTSAAFLVMEQADAVAEPWPFEEFCREMSQLLYKKGGPAVGIVILSPSRIEAGTGYELLVLGTSTDDVEARARAVEAAFQERQEPAPCHLISP
jgi:hypothetical protein